MEANGKPRKRQSLFTALAYKLYERRLWKQIKDGPAPNHIGIILDGNRRFAKKYGMDANWGHFMGYEKVKDVLDWCLDLKIKTLTLYVLSTENFKRPEEELKALMGLIMKACEEVKADPRIHENQVRVAAIGRLNLLPAEAQAAIHSLEDSTKQYDRLFLNMAVAYGGRAEIIDSIKRIAKDVKEGSINIDDITDETVQQHLYKNGPDPDMIIRTSGEKRLSGFLLWQSAYSELYFEDAYFPEFRKIDFWRAIRAFQKRERRFGT
ncbi:MAG: di-trans,poly-cis-decaprenylcistransferase [Candidatus Lokiarchaeota archaeon]|nr:di-trans,poly-cis-decaprenylcistransferase [Candidatus Lokiarchaeota archaeon]